MASVHCLPSALYDSVARSLPNRKSHAMRNQTSLPLSSRRNTSSRFTPTTALSLSVNSTDSFVATIYRRLPFFTTDSKAASPWKAESPATSPSFILLRSRCIVPWHAGPSVRFVSVLGARKMCGAMRDVFSRSQPLRSVSDHASSTGLWFHCHCSANLSLSKWSL